MNRRLLILFGFLYAGACGCGPMGTREKATIRVIGEDGRPIANANVSVTFVVHNWSEHKTSSCDGTSDANGLFSGVGRTTDYVHFGAVKPGYYPTTGKSALLQPDGRRKSGLPGGHRVDAMLKQIIKPVPMFAKYAALGVPAANTPVRYDLQAGDWLSPYGKGKEPDLVFTYTPTTYKLANGLDNTDTELKVTFSRPGDGLIALIGPPLREGSELRSPHEAPSTGYQSEWVQFNRLNDSGIRKNNIEYNRIFVLRLRTVMDQAGNVVSANYGKIYGDFNLSQEVAHYFNPEMNSRNLEFDRDRNLTAENSRGAMRMEFP